MHIAPLGDIVTPKKHDAEGSARAQNSRVLRLKTGAPQQSVQNAKPPMWPRLSTRLSSSKSEPRILFILALAAILAYAPFIAQIHAAEPLAIGLAKVDVTPPVGHRMSGYFYERFSAGTHDPLIARAIVLQQGDQQFAWVFCDLLGVPSHVTAPARDAASQATGIPRQNIFIAATHTHTGPLYFGPLRDYFHKRAVETQGADSHEPDDYAVELKDKLVAVIEQAAEAVSPTELAAGTATQQGLAFNRRYVMRDGSVRTNAGKLNPDIVRPAGPTDPQVGLLQFRRDGQPVAGLTVFALHLDTTGGDRYAADFPFFLARNLRQALGEKYQSIFGIGACGDINHFDVSHDRPQKSHEEAERIGSTLAATVASALKTLPAVEAPSLAAASRTVDVPLQKYTPEEIAAARANLPKVGTRELPMLEQVSAVKIVGVADYDTESLPMDVQAFRLSDSVALVALPGELFAELGLAIKQRSPFATTLVCELANDYPGYIPTRRGFAEGSYEPTNSKIEPGGGEMLVDAAVELLTQLHPHADPGKSAAAADSSEESQITVLQGANLIDGTGAPAQQRVDLILDGPRIMHVGPSGEKPAPVGAKVLDLHGKSIIPGLISAHAHIGQVDGLANGGQNYNRENILRQLRQYEAYGVTTIASLGLNGPLFYELRPQLHAGELPGADLFGGDRGIGVAGGAPPAAALKIADDQLDRPETPEAARAAVQGAKVRGADMVKFWVDDFRGSLPTKMKPEIYAAIIDEAHKQGLRAAAHVYYLDDAKALVKEGLDVLAHGIRDKPVDGELIDAMKSHSTWYIATIGVDESAYVYADQPDWMAGDFFLHALQPALRTQFESAEWRAGILANRALSASRDAVKMSQQNLAALHKAGVKIGFGADSGANPLRIPGFAEHRELQLMVDAGLTPLAAIHAATAGSAELLGLDDRGHLAAGKQADFIVLDADPGENIAAAQQIHAVWHRGQKVSGLVTEFTP